MTETVERTDGAAIGRSDRRKEDARLLTGRTNWTDNIQLPGTLHMATLRSSVAHARITRIDTSAAAAAEGVFAVYTGADFPDLLGTTCVWPVTDDIKTATMPAICTDKVNFAGDVVAVVLATEQSLAVDALELVDVDYEPLPAVVDMEAALAEGSQTVHADFGTNQCFTMNVPWGDYAAAKAKADVVVSRRFINQRLIPNPMEPRSVVAAPMGMSDEITIWSSTQIPHVLRVLLALLTGIPENNIRVVAPDVGGGFGAKLQINREEVLSIVLAKKLGRPVKWTEGRSEHFVSTHHGRDQIQDIEIAATSDGTILGLKVDLKADMGAYLQIITPGTPLLGMFMYSGIYKMDALDFTCTGVYTNKTPTDAYRGAGRPEATYAIERIVDELAHELGMEPLELRKKNWIKHEEFPYTQIAGLTYDTGNYEAATARAVELFGYDELRAEQAARRGERRQGPARHRHLDVHRDVRPRAVAHPGRAEVRRGRLGALHDPRDARPARSSSSPARRPTARATRPPGARSPATSSASLSRTSRSCTATPVARRTAWTRMARARSRSAARRSRRPASGSWRRRGSWPRTSSR